MGERSFARELELACLSLLSQDLRRQPVRKKGKVKKAANAGAILRTVPGILTVR